MKNTTLEMKTEQIMEGDKVYNLLKTINKYKDNESNYSKNKSLFINRLFNLEYNLKKIYIKSNKKENPETFTLETINNLDIQKISKILNIDDINEMELNLLEFISIMLHENVDISKLKINLTNNIVRVQNVKTIEESSLEIVFDIDEEGTFYYVNDYTVDDLYKDILMFIRLNKNFKIESEQLKIEEDDKNVFTPIEIISEISYKKESMLRHRTIMENLYLITKEIDSIKVEINNNTTLYPICRGDEPPYIDLNRLNNLIWLYNNGKSTELEFISCIGTNLGLIDYLYLTTLIPIDFSKYGINIIDSRRIEITTEHRGLILNIDFGCLRNIHVEDITKDIESQIEKLNLDKLNTMIQMFLLDPTDIYTFSEREILTVDIHTTTPMLDERKDDLFISLSSYYNSVPIISMYDHTRYTALLDKFIKEKFSKFGIIYKDNSSVDILKLDSKVVILKSINDKDKIDFSNIDNINNLELNLMEFIYILRTVRSFDITKIRIELDRGKIIVHEVNPEYAGLDIVFNMDKDDEIEYMNNYNIDDFYIDILTLIRDSFTIGTNTTLTQELDDINFKRYSRNKGE